MTPQEKLQFDNMLRKVDEMYEWYQARKLNQISFPVDDASRKNMGIGFIGKTTDTTPTGCIIVQSNEGPIKLLRAA